MLAKIREALASGVTGRQAWCTGAPSPKGWSVLALCDVEAYAMLKTTTRGVICASGNARAPEIAKSALSWPPARIES
jgi:hypothetical protein